MNPTEYAIQAFPRGDWVVLRAPGSGKNRWKFWAVRREGVSTTRVWGTRIGPDQGHAQTNAGSDEVLLRDIRKKIDERQHQVRAVLKGAQSLPLSFSPDDLPGMLDPAAHPERSIRGEELSGHQLASALTFSPRVWEPTPAKGATRSIRGDALLARRGWRASPPGRDLRTSSRYDVNTDYVRQVIQNGQWVALQRTRDGPGGPSHAYWAIRLAASDDGSGGEWHYREGATIGPTRGQASTSEAPFQNGFANVFKRLRAGNRVRAVCPGRSVGPAGFQSQSDPISALDAQAHPGFFTSTDLD